MKRTNKEKRRALRKRIRAEKQRLRRRAKKHRPRKWVYMTLEFMEMETIEALRKYAREHKMSVNKVITKALEAAMSREALKTSIMKWEVENGVQHQTDTSVE